ncbi:MAG: DNA translocase FtsK [Patescibacteria group bacterium]
MSKKNRKRDRRDFARDIPEPKDREPRLHPEAKKSIWAVAFAGVAIILVLAAARRAGPLGEIIYSALDTLMGLGYFILPGALVLAAIILIFSDKQKLVSITLLGSGFLVLAVLGLIELLYPGSGGWLGLVLASLRYPFGNSAAIVINILLLIISIIIAANTPIKIRWPEKKEGEDAKEPVITGAADQKETLSVSEKKEKTPEPEEAITSLEKDTENFPRKSASSPRKSASRLEHSAGYVPPPLSLLKSAADKPTTGDLLANANVIKRTLDSFGIPVEMGEINVGPAVTRYTLKPAEGVKLSRIEALHKDLSLALAAHPIRIEAPIPGKSLVGIEVPNKAAALVRLGSLMNYPEFQKSGSLGFSMGRDVSGEPVFADIERMPHMLIAGATGSGKSILIHSLIVSLLYKNSPATLKMVMIDPKRVELSIYEGIPHLVSPVITESKKTIGVFKWAINEMERRYDVLLQAGARDVKSYNASHKDEPIPYLIIVIDELADLMASYGREVEGSIVRLAQMARATGLHLVLSTQRPSVEVITGLIKANITTRIALQVASQIDSRTILDTSGAEKLLGHGDLLYISSELSKPKRIQGAYITEEEVNAVAGFIKKNNKAEAADEVDFASGNGANGNGATPSFDDYLDGDDDELYDEAVRVVSEAKKASASLLQRRLKVGYARAARLLDIMEERGVIGPGDGAKPREVYLSDERQH